MTVQHGVDDLNAAVAPVLNGQTLTYTLNSVAPTGVLVQWIYSQPPGLISDGVDLAPSRTLTAQTVTTDAVITDPADGQDIVDPFDLQAILDPGV